MTDPKPSNPMRSRPPSLSDAGASRGEGELFGPPRQPSGLLLSDDDLHWFGEGNHYRLYQKMGAHLDRERGDDGVRFAVWAPEARSVHVMGDFNGWDKGSLPLEPRGVSGIWTGFVPGLGQGEPYKYHIVSKLNDYRVDKGDPFAFFSRTAPDTTSLVWDLEYKWRDREWMERRTQHQPAATPESVYEVHLGSWRRPKDEPQRLLSYRELAPLLVEYVVEMGFTHVELMPIMEHPFYGSWGYQVTSYFAPTGRYGSPQDLMFLIDVLHQHGIGVILDWVPSHFPSDEHGLGFFDGSHLYEHQDPRKGFHPDWESFIFNYDRHEVRSFLLSSALFWLDRYHVDGLRVDAVASMLYLDYSRKQGEWLPNEYGGRENLGAIHFLRQLNETVYREHPGVQTVAEESTSWPMVSRPTYVGGLGFGKKWDMGWMHDTLAYFRLDPIYRKYHQDYLTFRQLYAGTENFVLSLSHDEVVHEKGSLLGKMPGDPWQQFANLRLLFAWMFAQQGKKLLFMGGEFGQWREWNHDQSLDWHLLEGSPQGDGKDSPHEGVRRWVADLNRLYREEPSLHRKDFDPEGFEWVDCTDMENSVVSLLRKGFPGDPEVLVAFNFTPVPQHNYRIGVPRGGRWIEVANSDATLYGGSGQGNLGGALAAPVGSHGRPWALNLALPPLGAVFFRHEGGDEA
jgi:1,4-alpha-glucan branching enzyme